jgi:periplasmic protein TonB
MGGSVNSTMNILPFANRFEADFKVISVALFLSLVMHVGIMRVLPWLESVKTPLPLNIIAELRTLAPPPPPPSTQSNPIQPPTKPALEKPIQRPTPKPQTVASPVLAARQTEQISNYTVPDIPKPAIMPTQPSPVAMPEPQTEEATVSTTSTMPTSVASSPTSTTWQDSDVWDEYGSDLQRLCERNKRYPAIAIRRGYQGSGKVLVRFSADGKTTSIRMEKSTGQKSLDDQAIEMVTKSLNELPLPAKFKGREFNLTIPIDFKLE